MGAFTLCIIYLVVLHFVGKSCTIRKIAASENSQLFMRYVGPGRIYRFRISLNAFFSENLARQKNIKAHVLQFEIDVHRKCALKRYVFFENH